jgi:predicted Zn-dependent protease
LQEKDASTALTLAEKAESLNPGFYQNTALQGRALLALGRFSEAARALERSLAEQPAFLKEKQELEVLLHQAQSSK